MTTPTIPPPDAKPYIEARIGSMNYRGDGLRCLWDGNGRNESAQEVLEELHRRCHAAESQLAAIHALLTPLLGTEGCTECNGNGGTDKYLSDDPTNKLMHGSHWYGCRACNGTGQRNVADGLSPLECVERVVADRCQKCGMGPMTRIADATYCSNCINLACADEEANGLNMWKEWADESEAGLIESRKQVSALRAFIKSNNTCYCTTGNRCERCLLLAETMPKETK